MYVPLYNTFYLKYRSNVVVVRYLTNVNITVTGTTELQISFPSKQYSYAAPGARKVIEIEQEETKELCNKIIKLLTRKDLSTVETFGVLEIVRHSFMAANIELEMKKRFGLVRVER